MRVTKLLLALFIASGVASCKSESNPVNPTPTNKTITVDVTYVSHGIENSTSFATWPVAKFPYDAAADSFQVRIYNYTGTWDRSEYTKKWKVGDKPPTDYGIYAPNDEKDGHQYFVVGRTWCSGCSGPNPEWEANYRKGMGEVKADVTYIYH